MKYFIGLIVASVLAAILALFNKHLLNGLMSDFFIGWICCTAYLVAKYLYENSTRKI
jgi:FtsH-binding integral membrane protein